MIGLDVARALKAAGFAWDPASGDRFVVPDRDMDDDIFVISEMTIEARAVVGGAELKFNGTTEWALDSIDQGEVIWLPRESQLREALGDRFVSLSGHGGVFSVRYLGADEAEDEVVSRDAEEAYAQAWLRLHRT